MYIKSLFILVVCLMCNVAQAVISPRSLGNESRIKIINYMPNTVFKFVGHYYYQSIIEFGLDEEIDTISMGTPTPWQIVPSGNRIFIKPVEDNATTNMTVITNKRMYFFEMHAEDAKDIGDNQLAFVVKFVYPSQGSAGGIKQVATSSGPDLSKPEKYNFRYTISGNAKLIEPVQIFDDGEYTYFKFRDINAEIPAIFIVDPFDNESIVNYRISGDFLVVERVAAKYTLRYGKQIICVFNELMEADLKRINKPKKNRFLFIR